MYLPDTRPTRGEEVFRNASRIKKWSVRPGKAVKIRKACTFKCLFDKKVIVWREYFDRVFSMGAPDPGNQFSEWIALLGQRRRNYRPDLVTNSFGKAVVSFTVETMHLRNTNRLRKLPNPGQNRLDIWIATQFWRNWYRQLFDRSLPGSQPPKP